MDTKTIRTRFAPSPTGYLHVGGVRTALFAWLLARQNGGQFILRLEDTDKSREVTGSTNHIIETLAWLELSWDEGIAFPGKPEKGDFGPYKQSDRVKSGLYKEWAEKLIASERAYADPYSAEEVEAFRNQARAEKRPFLFRDHRPPDPPKWDGKMPLRFKSEPQVHKWKDAVMGELSAGPEAIDDFILIKADGYPTYNFAHIVDDHDMKITHVIRGQEFIASTPRFLNLYDALGITKEERPILASVPPVLGSDGNKKLSKRDGAKDVLDFRNEGYFSDAVLNFLATLGWNDGSEKEDYTKDELINAFSLDKIQKSGAQFDEKRLIWLNGKHIRDHMSFETLMKCVEPFGPGAPTYWPKEAVGNYPKNYRVEVLEIVRERLKFFDELKDLTWFFFTEKLEVDEKLIKSHKKLKDISPDVLKDLLTKTKLELAESDFTKEDLRSRLNNLLIETDQKPAVLFSLIRIATTQAPSSPDLIDTLHVLGKKRSIDRIDQQIEALSIT